MTYEDFSKMKSLFMEVIEADGFIGDIVKGDYSVNGGRFEYLHGTFGKSTNPLVCHIEIDLVDKKEPKIEYVCNGTVGPDYFDKMRDCVTKIIEIYNNWEKDA